jgi:hypothetical protein
MSFSISLTVRLIRHAEDNLARQSATKARGDLRGNKLILFRDHAACRGVSATGEGNSPCVGEPVRIFARPYVRRAVPFLRTQRGGRAMVGQIVIEAETPGDSRTMFRLRIDASLIAEDLTAVHAHLLVGEILERIAVPKSSVGASPESDAASQAPFGVPTPRRWVRWLEADMAIRRRQCRRFPRVHG